MPGWRSTLWPSVSRPFLWIIISFYHDTFPMFIALYLCDGVLRSSFYFSFFDSYLFFTSSGAGWVVHFFRHLFFLYNLQEGSLVRDH